MPIRTAKYSWDWQKCWRAAHNRGLSPRPRRLLERTALFMVESESLLPHRIKDPGPIRIPAGQPRGDNRTARTAAQRPQPSLSAWLRFGCTSAAGPGDLPHAVEVLVLAAWSRSRFREHRLAPLADQSVSS